MNDGRTHVAIDPHQPDKVKIIIDGPTVSTFNVLSRAEAFVLAWQITQYLRETEKK